MSNYFNEAGEPLMDGSAMRYEMYLDSTYEPEFDPYDHYEDGDIDPDDCDHADGTYLGSSDGDVTEGDYECDLCGSIEGRWVLDEDGWPQRVLDTATPVAQDEPVLEDQWLDSYMEDRISEMYI